MKIRITALFLLLSALLLTGCGKQTFIDLTSLSEGFAYETVTNIIQNPDEYLNKRIRVKGYFDTVHSDYTNRDYYYVVVQDVTVCCTQGIEFIWEGIHSKEEYPAKMTGIIIEGDYKSYFEEDQLYHYISTDRIETYDINEQQ